jgi:hypothetical protein
MRDIKLPKYEKWANYDAYLPLSGTAISIVLEFETHACGMPSCGAETGRFGHQSLLPLGHSSTENSCQGSVGEKSRHEFECPRSVGLISKFSAFVLLRACVGSSGDGAKPQGLSPQGHGTARRPSHFHHGSGMNDLIRGDR